MRFLRVIPLLLTVALIWLLDHPMGALPALGRLIDPVNGAMAAAEPVNQDFNKSLHLAALQAPVNIWLEDRLVPHVRAENDHDLYYTQGYIHAYFRLWQMDLQTRAAGGRVSEVVGPRAIEFDRGIRREGMVWGAQHSLDAMEREPRTKAMLDAYRDGINAYIHTLRYRDLPVEYKLMGFAPEDWTNLRTALLMKYMARDLTGQTDDIAFTLLRDQLGQEQFDFLFPEKIKGSKPVIPEGTPFAKPSMTIPKAPGDSVWAHFPKSVAGSRQSAVQSEFRHPNAEIAKGSNNWAISGAHTASGKPILCNDPHLALNLPSLWYEMQLTAPGINVYGASLPGAPGIVIGFNQKISWGFTNNYRDVKDFYEITPLSMKFVTTREARGVDAIDQMIKPDSAKLKGVTVWERPRTYWFCGKEVPFQRGVEVIKVKGAPDIVDTVLYTIHGPVTFDPSFPDEAKSGKLLACTWMAHRGSNELLATYLLNRAGDYATFTDAIQHFECPAQNIAYADGAGNIAIWGQGQFINKWKGQGKYVMEGRDSLTLWGADIPMSENPHVLNPPQGYVASANQSVTDSTYPYWYNGSFVEWRSWEINAAILMNITLDTAALMPFLRLTENIIIPEIVCIISPPQARNGRSVEVDDLMRLQNSERSLLNTNLLYPHSWNDKTPNAGKLIPEPMEGSVIRGDELYSDRSSRGTETQIFWSQLYKDMWQDEFPNPATKWPSSERTIQLLLSDSTSKYYDDKTTQQIETLRDIVQRAFRETTDSLSKLRQNESASQRVNDSTSPLEWYKVKNTSLTHLAKIPAFSYDHLKIGGWSNTINACTGDHGPSWRMIVEMDSIPKAYAVYPGGQSGNPGSPHYGDFIENWVEGKYFTIQFLTAAITKNPFKYTWTLTP